MEFNEKIGSPYRSGTGHGQTRLLGSQLPVHTQPALFTPLSIYFPMFACPQSILFPPFSY